MPESPSPPQSAPSPSLVRRLLPKLLLVATSLGVSLLVGELAVRIARPQEVMTVDRGLYAPDPPRRYRLHPGYRGRISNRVEFDHAVTIDAHGMRTSQPTLEAAQRRAGGPELRVLVLGDSFTFGVGARDDETFPARLEEQLRRRGVDAVVWNAGAPGFGVPDEVAWYERWGVPLKPDVVVIAPFLANDLQDAMPGSQTRVVDGELVAGDGGGGARRWLYYHSHLFRLFKSAVLEGPLRAKLGLAEPWARRERRSELALYRSEPPSELMPGLAATDRAVERLAARAARESTRTLAVFVPSLPQVDGDRWRALHEELGVDPRPHDRRRPNVLFAAIFRQHDVPVVDPTDALAAAIAAGEQIYYPRDQHLTPRGYDLLANEVARALVAGRPAPTDAVSPKPRAPAPRTP